MKESEYKWCPFASPLAVAGQKEMGCIGDECAFWDKDLKRCAVLVIADRLGQIACALERML